MDQRLQILLKHEPSGRCFEVGKRLCSYNESSVLKPSSAFMKNIMITKLVYILFLLTVSCNNQKKNDIEKNAKGEVVYINPEGLHKNPAYSQLVITKGPMKTIYVGGQNATNKEGQLVGKGNIKAQAVQTLSNLKIALTAGGASLSNVIKWNVYIVEGHNARVAFEALQEDLQKMPHPPAITGVYVAALAQPNYLLEMDAVAVVAE
jgi:enamine deaminase RidA (YjgF/YER057c/UK114 family)